MTEVHKDSIPDIRGIRRRLTTFYYARSTLIDHLAKRNSDGVKEELAKMQSTLAEIKEIVDKSKKRSFRPDYNLKCQLAALREEGLSFEWLKSISKKPRLSKFSGLKTKSGIHTLKDAEVIVADRSSATRPHDGLAWARGPKFQSAINLIPELERAEKIRAARLEQVRMLREKKRAKQAALAVNETHDRKPNETFTCETEEM